MHSKCIQCGFESHRGHRVDGRVRVRPVMVTDIWTDTDAPADLARRVDAGTLTPRVHEVLRPEQAADAHRLLAAGGLRGRPVLDFS
ncbi:zinc-binding dehydrogenase [Pseudonocardia sp. ICBG1293]|uniref:zinc-binding dehydrogenase n=1 Tax=Pseudonocardia sp. ICBG1293 TaxID=2844382 RepID=UPI001CC9B00A|nr:zinc-binding dehydrogenase [Pseudonocardia sp. ICBG1293]